MATSGTVGTTVIDSAMVLEHAFRRCRVKPASQTPEIVATSLENLYLLLLSLSNRGINLWCVEQDIVSLYTGQQVYDMPTGTIDVLNLVYSQPTRVTGTDSSTATSYTTQLASASKVIRVGIKCSAITTSSTLTIAHSPDGATWTTSVTSTKTDWAANQFYWFSLDPTVTDTYFKATFTGAATFTEFYLAGSSYDLPLTQWNRDTWAAINNKTQAGHPSTNYYLEKLIAPRVTLWPVPDGPYYHAQVWIHRQVQDVGSLSQQLAIPQRWVNGIIWQLCEILCFELDVVDQVLIPNILTMAAQHLIEAEQNETDGAPIMLQPGISVYTR